VKADIRSNNAAYAFSNSSLAAQVGAGADWSLTGTYLFAQVSISSVHTRASTTAMNDRVAALPQTSVANTGLASRPLKAADKMELIASGRASLCLISTVPAGATIDVDGKKVGVTPMSLVLLKGDHGPRSVDIYRESNSIIHHDLEPTGQTIALNDKLVALTSHP
jgi:hypothetical protein